ncbi:hypothetical protein ACN28E_40740 [Archangium lansingense]|uniref:hypothetical protein n=1 Tax=Archangiaceae TaxID=39 RepID=UPI000D3B2788|nr:hypothetical protein [Vitiosangium sp. GDMCC 1.1324]PTL75037.1 hypothetical protein DAT35_57055 [Vitiosangium sp. GDMCC 1.1324]
MSLKVDVIPATNDLILTRDQTLAEVVKAIIPKAEEAAKVDVYFLADTTGSMNTAIAAVKTGISAILAAVANLGADVQFGVGNYKDFPAPVASEHPYAFQHQRSITANSKDITDAINTWQTTAGRDTPEAQFYALDQVAEPPGGKVGWREEAQRLVVWFGDAAGHDPVCKAISGLSYDITEKSVTDKLLAQKIVVLALSMDTNYRAPAGLDDDPKTTSTGYKSKCGEPAGTSGQGTRIANATGGKLIQGVSAQGVVETITAQLRARITQIDNVRLVPAGDTARFVRSMTPAQGHGPLSRDQRHEVAFDVAWVGVVASTPQPQVFKGSLDVVADGRVVGGKPVTITVPASVKVSDELPPIEPEEDVPVNRPDDVSGQWMLIHQVTGTYFECDNYSPNVNDAVQVWHEDPPRTTPLLRGHLWNLIKQADGTYRIRTDEKNPGLARELYLEASPNTATKAGDDFPRMKDKADTDLQSWRLVPVSGDAETYAIVPARFPEYALGIYQNFCVTDKFVTATRTWGRPTFHHYWRLSKPPAVALPKP